MSSSKPNIPEFHFAIKTDIISYYLLTNFTTLRL